MAKKMSGAQRLSEELEKYKQAKAAYQAGEGPKPDPTAPIVVLSLVAIAVCFSAYVIWNGNAPPRRPASKPPDASRSALRLAGDEAVIDPGGTGVFLAVDEESYDRVTTLSRAEDRAGIAALMASGRVFVVNGGTRALVIDPGFSSTEVRLLDGPHAGQSGLVLAESVK